MMNQIKGNMDMGTSLKELMKGYDIEIDHKTSKPEENICVVKTLPKKETEMMPPMIWTVNVEKGFITDAKFLNRKGDIVVDLQVEEIEKIKGKWMPVKIKTIMKGSDGLEVVTHTTSLINRINEGVVDNDFRLVEEK